MRRVLVFVALAAFVAALARLALPAAAWANPDFASLEKSFKLGFQSKKYEERLRSFEMWRTSRDPQAADVLVWAANTLVEEWDALRKSEEETEAGLEATITKIEALKKALNEKGALSPKDMDAFNRRVGKLEKEHDGYEAKQRELATRRAQGRALADASTTAIGALGTNLAPADLTSLLDRLETEWGGPKSTPIDRLRLVDAISRIRQAPAGQRLRGYAANDTEDGRVRATALSVRVTRDDPGAFEDAIAALAGKAPWEVKAEAIDACRRLHRRAGIEPLIAFLGVDGIGRLREDATRALRSLTGQAHGPYQQPWKAWWDGAKESFVMPEKPADAAGGMPDKGVTFYGITTFSDHVLFVLDVSGSMLEPMDATKQRLEPTKIAVAKKELMGAIDMLDDTKKFNLVFFNHTVVRYKPGMIVADKVARDLAKRFAQELEPTGGTNIHDALETGFRMAGTADGKSYESLVDTIYFMTDGTPTAGKIQDPKDILAEVRMWNASAHITIHCVGVGGDCDEAFLKALAEQNGGQFVKR